MRIFDTGRPNVRAGSFQNFRQKREKWRRKINRIGSIAVYNFKDNIITIQEARFRF